MLRVLVVDDEPYVIQGLKIIIEWEKYGFEIVDTAKDGKEALQYIKENKVDVVITDIKMPNMTGIELLEEAKKITNVNIFFIILSGYSDFEYVRKAMQNHCIDYLLKPINQKELVRVLMQVKQEHDDHMAEEESNIKMEKAYFARKVISILNNKGSMEDITYVEEYLQIEKDSCFVDIQFKLEAEEDEKILRQIQYRLDAACREFLKDKENHCIFDVSSNSQYYGIGLIFTENLLDKNESMEEYLEKLARYLKRALQRKILLFVGKKVQETERLSESYMTAYRLYYLHAFYDKKIIYYYGEEMQENENATILCKECVDELVKVMEQGDHEKINEEIDKLYQKLHQMNASEKVINLNLNYLMFQMIQLATNQDDEVNQEEILRYISENAMDEEFIRGGISHLKMFAREYSTYLIQLRKNTSHGVLAKIEQDIKINYAQNLSLKEMGQKYFVNSAYLGQIFQKQYGSSFREYLNCYRIEVAAQKLIRTQDKIYQIASDVGYKNLDYFINKFIEMKGCTPSKFRRQSQEVKENSWIGK